MKNVPSAVTPWNVRELKVQVERTWNQALDLQGVQAGLEKHTQNEWPTFKSGYQLNFPLPSYCAFFLCLQPLNKVQPWWLGGLGRQLSHLLRLGYGGSNPVEGMVC